MSWISVIASGVAKLNAWFAVMLSGGSIASWSVTPLACTVTVQDSFSTKSVSGLSVNVVGPPLTVAVWLPLVTQLMSNQVPVTFTGSLKVMSTFAFTATSPAPFAGVVVVTDGWRVGAVEAEPVERVVGEAVPLDRRIEDVASDRVSRLDGALPPERVVRRARQSGAPFRPGIEADLADDVDDRRSLPQDDRVVAVEPAGPVRLVCLGEDGCVRGGLREDVDVPVGDRPRAGEVDRETRRSRAVEEHLDVVATAPRDRPRPPSRCRSRWPCCCSSPRCTRR